MKPLKVLVGHLYSITFKKQAHDAHLIARVGDKLKCRIVGSNKLILIPPANILGEVTDNTLEDSPNKGFTHFDIKWRDNKYQWFTSVNNMRFYGEWRKIDPITPDEKYLESVIDIRCSRGQHDHMCLTIPYTGDPRTNIKSLNADICAGITRWLHDHPFEGSTCAHCGCTEHQEKSPSDKCVAYQRQLLSGSKIMIRRVETIDTLILKLKEFRDTSLRCGGNRGFMVEGDGGASLKVWLDVDLTSQAMLLKGKCPPLASTGRIDAITDEDDEDHPRASSKDKAPAEGNVADMVNRLNTASDPAEKRKIRAMLRRMGHKGGSRSVGKGE